MKKTLDYGVVIIGCCFLIVFLSVGVGYNCWSVLTIPICDGLHVSRQQFSVLFTLISVGRMVSSAGLGYIMTRCRGTYILRAGALALPLTLAFASRMRGLAELYAVGLLIGLVLPALSFYLLSILLGNWFVRLRGTATGIVFMGSGLGGLIFTPLLSGWIVSFGWRRSILILAGICACVLIPICFKVIVFAPEEMGLHPDGEREGCGAPPKKTQGIPMGALTGRASFWMFLLFTSSAYASVAIINTITPFLSDSNFGYARTAMVFSMAMGSVAVSRFVSGILCDKIGAIWATVICGMLSVLLLVGLLTVNAAPPMCVLIVVGAGMANAVYTVCFPLIVSRLFGERDYSRIYGAVSAAGELISAVSPIVYGYLYAGTGSYISAYRLFFGFAVAGMLCLAVSLRCLPGAGDGRKSG